MTSAWADTIDAELANEESHLENDVLAGPQDWHWLGSALGHEPWAQSTQVVAGHQHHCIGGAIGFLAKLSEDRPTAIGPLTQDDHIKSHPPLEKSRH